MENIGCINGVSNDFNYFYDNSSKGYLDLNGFEFCGIWMNYFVRCCSIFLGILFVDLLKWDLICLFLKILVFMVFFLVDDLFL